MYFIWKIFLFNFQSAIVYSIGFTERNFELNLKFIVLYGKVRIFANNRKISTENIADIKRGREEQWIEILLVSTKLFGMKECCKNSCLFIDHKAELVPNIIKLSQTIKKSKLYHFATLKNV